MKNQQNNKQEVKKLGFFARRKQQKLEHLEKLSKLQETIKVKTESFESEFKKHDRMGFWKRIFSVFSKKILCKVVIKYPDGVDVIKYVKMIRPFVLEIGRDYYMFSPKSFRYESKFPKLEFYYGVPFAILHDVTKPYSVPSLDTEAFTSVMKGKYIQDLMADDAKDLTGLQIAVIIISVLGLILAIVNIVMTLQLKKAVNALGVPA